MQEDDVALRLPVQGVIDVVCKKWALMIIAVLRCNGRLRYNGIMRELTGISTKTLSDTLKQLEKSGIIRR